MYIFPFCLLFRLNVCLQLTHISFFFLFFFFRFRWIEHRKSVNKFETSHTISTVVDYYYWKWWRKFLFERTYFVTFGAESAKGATKSNLKWKKQEFFRVIRPTEKSSPIRYETNRNKTIYMPEHCALAESKAEIDNEHSQNEWLNSERPSRFLYKNKTESALRHTEEDQRKVDKKCAIPKKKQNKRKLFNRSGQYQFKASIIIILNANKLYL